ncbi:MAG: TonB C-terminal domain-containing protein [Nitrospirae bacterium]|nr:TonB C-terminal domain-containing protein [Nitrospirota bacterium]
MRNTLNIGKEPNFQIIVITSAILHLLLITLIVVPLKTRKDEYKSYFVNLVGPIESVRETKGNENNHLSPLVKENELSKPLPKADMSLEPSDKVSKEISRMSAISVLSKLKKKKEAGTAHEIEIIRQKIQASVAKGPGIPGAVQSMKSDSYYSLITRKIWSEWIYPETGSAGLEVIIAVKLDREGKVISHEIEKSSGNSLFDRSALKAISKASPLPPPPVEIEIGVRFYL